MEYKIEWLLPRIDIDDGHMEVGDDISKRYHAIGMTGT